MRTTSRGSGSVDNLENVALVPTGASCPNDAAKGPREAALPADHLADVVGRDMKMEDDGVLTLLRLDPHGVRLVDEPARQPLEELGHRLSRRCRQP